MMPSTRPRSRVTVDTAKRTHDAMPTSRTRRESCGSVAPGLAVASVGAPSISALPGSSGVDSSAELRCGAGFAGESGAFTMMSKCVG